MATLAQTSRAVPAARASRVLVLAAVLVVALGGLMMLGLLLGTPQLAPNDLGTIANGGTTRFSFGPFLSKQDVKYATDALAAVASRTVAVR